MLKHWAPKWKLVPECVISLNWDLQLIDVWPLPCLIGLLAALLPLSWPMQFTFWSFMLSFSGSTWIWKIAPRKCHCTVFFPPSVILWCVLHLGCDTVWWIDKCTTKTRTEGKGLQLWSKRGRKRRRAGGIASETFEFDISTAIHL